MIDSDIFNRCQCCGKQLGESGVHYLAKVRVCRKCYRREHYPLTIEEAREMGDGQSVIVAVCVAFLAFVVLFLGSR